MTQRIRIRIEGIVQGVGFRPFVYREACDCGLAGWVRNDSRGVLIEAEGLPEKLAVFVARLQQRLPPLASITRIDQRDVPVQGGSGFVIDHSAQQAEASAQIAPDSSVCDDCLRELFDPEDRRYRYPFINCTNCGPRFSIVTGIPYDRPKTTMATFAMCARCRSEYTDPGSRRFHAQPNACPDCGPHLTLLRADGRRHASDTPLETAIDLLRRGSILAIKGLGGYHLAVDASNDRAVAELRRRKHRDEKPFALMSRDLALVRQYARADDEEARLLSGTERPIVLLERKKGHRLSPRVAPRNRYFGVMLPYTPLHYLLLEDHFPALVMTSGNLTDEPIVYQDDDACCRLAEVADFFLTHNRPIFTRTDDSIARMMAKQPVLLRRSRGYVPRGIALAASQDSILAVGAELKNTFCMTRGDRAYLSHHVGDLKNLDVYRSFEQGIDHLQQILAWRPQAIAHDLHPDSLSSRYALEQNDLPTVAVQHHHAHLVSCMAEHGVSEPCLGMIFDGIGYGADGHLWGGEFLLGDANGYRRLGHFAELPLPGGDAATRQPWRMAVSLLSRVYGADLPDLPFLEHVPPHELTLLQQVIEKGINSPPTSSCGRLFDAVAALVGLRHEISFEGQAALELEMAIETGIGHPPYPYHLRQEKERLIFDPVPLTEALVDDLRKDVSPGRISGRFHVTLSTMIVEVCRRLQKQTQINRVVLSGGVFQNRFLTETACRELLNSGFHVLTHCRVPPNDGGVSLGQAVVAGAVRFRKS